MSECHCVFVAVFVKEIKAKLGRKYVTQVFVVFGGKNLQLEGQLPPSPPCSATPDCHLSVFV